MLCCCCCVAGRSVSSGVQTSSTWRAAWSTRSTSVWQPLTKVRAQQARMRSPASVDICPAAVCLWLHPQPAVLSSFRLQLAGVRTCVCHCCADWCLLMLLCHVQSAWRVLRWRPRLCARLGRTCCGCRSAWKQRRQEGEEPGTRCSRPSIAQ